MSRAVSAGARKAARHASSHLDRSVTWNGLRAGDPVTVGGPVMRGTTWEFRAFIRNRNNGTESVEVVGGRPGDRAVRSFPPERIFAVAGPRRRNGGSAATTGRLSLAEAPQLPFG